MQQPKVILSPLPKLYVYDHCPFCVRARLAFGLKSIKHELIFLGNDDVATPTALVGKKIAPIFTVDGQSMPESLDIIAKVDTDARFDMYHCFSSICSTYPLISRIYVTQVWYRWFLQTDEWPG
jgi:hypothetical protein